MRGWSATGVGNGRVKRDLTAIRAGGCALVLAAGVAAATATAHAQGPAGSGGLAQAGTAQAGSVQPEPSASLRQADAAYRAGVAALARNNLNEARADFERVVRLSPQAEQGHSALGAVLVRVGETAAGIRELEKALVMKPSDGSAQLNLALVYEQSGEPVKALPLFARLDAEARTARRAQPSYVLAAHARALAATRHTEAATAIMKTAVAEEAGNADLHDELGSLYAQQQKWSQAQAQFAEAVRLAPKLDPGSAAAHLHLGLALEAQQQPGAVDELEQAEQLAPGNALIAVELGKALVAEGKDEQAIPLFESVVQAGSGQPQQGPGQIDAEQAAAAYQLALALQRTGKAQAAIPLFQKVVAAEPENVDALTNLGMALTQTQQAKEAVPLLQRAVKLAPDGPTVHQDLAAAYIQLSQFDDSIAELRTAIKLAPNAPAPHYNLGLALKMQDDAAGAIPELETAQKLDPTAPEPPYVLGVLYMQTGRYQDAAAELNASLKLQPANGDGWATLGSVYNKLDKLPEAVAALREAIRQSPQQPDPHLTLAAVLAKENQSAEATAERKTAAGLMRTNMNRQRAEVATSSGKAKLQSGKVEDAVVEFKDALSYDPDYAEAHRGMADALEREGKGAEAAAERAKAESLANGASQ